jgi:hypothetical protein
MRTSVRAVASLACGAVGCSLLFTFPESKGEDGGLGTRPPPDAGPVIACGDAFCKVPGFCCRSGDAAHFAYACLPVGSNCNIGKGELAIRCDDPGDCASGTTCCVNGVPAIMCVSPTAFNCVDPNAAFVCDPEAPSCPDGGACTLDALYGTGLYLCPLHGR